jgi:hypothetical protein
MLSSGRIRSSAAAILGLCGATLISCDLSVILAMRISPYPTLDKPSCRVFFVLFFAITAPGIYFIWRKQGPGLLRVFYWANRSLYGKVFCLASCIFAAIFFQLGLFQSIYAVEVLGSFELARSYKELLLLFYMPGIRLFWLIDSRPTVQFDIVYGVWGILFVVSLYSLAIGIIVNILIHFCIKLPRE